MPCKVNNLYFYFSTFFASRWDANNTSEEYLFILLYPCLRHLDYFCFFTLLLFTGRWIFHYLRGSVCSRVSSDLSRIFTAFFIIRSRRVFLTDFVISFPPVCCHSTAWSCNRRRRIRFRRESSMVEFKTFPVP